MGVRGSTPFRKRLIPAWGPKMVWGESLVTAFAKYLYRCLFFHILPSQCVIYCLRLYGAASTKLWPRSNLELTTSSPTEYSEEIWRSPGCRTRRPTCLLRPQRRRCSQALLRQSGAAGSLSQFDRPLTCVRPSRRAASIVVCHSTSRRINNMLFSGTREIWLCHATDQPLIRWAVHAVRAIFSGFFASLKSFNYKNVYVQEMWVIVQTSSACRDLLLIQQLNKQQILGMRSFSALLPR